MDKFLFDDKTLDLVLTYAPKLLVAILMTVGGLWLIKHFTDAADKGMKRSGIDPDLRPFLTTMLNIFL